MKHFDKHTLNVLEYFKIIEILKGLCITPYGIEHVERILPSRDFESITSRLNEVSQMKGIIQFGTAFPLARIENASDLIVKSRTEGIILEPKK